MKTLLNNLIAILNAAIVAGTLSVTTVFKGLQDDPEQVADSQFPYLMLDDGGEFTEDTDPAVSYSQSRTYNIVLEIGCYSIADVTTALDQVLDITDEVKTILETSIKIAGGGDAQKYEFKWGITITPFGWTNSGSFFRGRQIIVSYTELEDTVDKY